MELINGFRQELAKFTIANITCLPFVALDKVWQERGALRYITPQEGVKVRKENRDYFRIC